MSNGQAQSGRKEYTGLTWPRKDTVKSPPRAVEFPFLMGSTMPVAEEVGVRVPPALVDSTLVADVVPAPGQGKHAMNTRAG